MSVPRRRKDWVAVPQSRNTPVVKVVLRRDCDFVPIVKVGGGPASALGFRRQGVELRLDATHLSEWTDPPRELLSGLQTFAEGRQAVTVLWRREPGGCFVELRTLDCQVDSVPAAQLLVHNFVDPDWGSRDWVDERGDVLFSGSGGKLDMLHKFIDAFDASRGAFDEIAERRSFTYKFPAVELDRLRATVSETCDGS